MRGEWGECAAWSWLMTLKASKKANADRYNAINNKISIKLFAGRFPDSLIDMRPTIKLFSPGEEP
jgi:hypothetical protein